LGDELPTTARLFLSHLAGPEAGDQDERFHWSSEAEQATFSRKGLPGKF
jgi:hypothetical protein